MTVNAAIDEEEVAPAGADSEAETEEEEAAAAAVDSAGRTETAVGLETIASKTGSPGNGCGSQDGT